MSWTTRPLPGHHQQKDCLPTSNRTGTSLSKTSAASLSTFSPVNLLQSFSSRSSNNSSYNSHNNGPNNGRIMGGWDKNQRRQRAFPFGSTTGQPFSTITTSRIASRLIVVTIALFFCSFLYLFHSVHTTTMTGISTNTLFSSFSGDCTDGESFFPHLLDAPQLRRTTGSAPAAAATRWSRRRTFEDDKESTKASTIFTLEHPPTHYPYDIVHTLTTRFMVGQSNQTDWLARARILLFETFCYPTVRYQSRRNVFWFVLADPKLPSDVLDRLRQLLQNVPSGFAYLVLTNRTDWASDGIGVPNATGYGVHWPTVADELRTGQLDVVTGNTTHLFVALDRIQGKQQGGRRILLGTWGQSADESLKTDQDEAKPLLVIETILDADDGLNNQGIEWLQDAAVQGTLEQQNLLSSSGSASSSKTLPPSLDSTWWFVCGTDHIEWHNRDIFRIAPEDFAMLGIQSGLTGWRHKPYFCTSAGFTRIGLTIIPEPASRGFLRQQDVPSDLLKFPKDAYSNHALAFYFPECTDNPLNITMVHCYRRQFEGNPYILKSRSITSDSMDHMNSRKPDDYRDVGWVNKTEFPLLINETERTWYLLETEFAISRYNAWKTSLFMYNNREEIILENKGSRCAPGFPCNKSAKKMLAQMQRFWKSQERRTGQRASLTNLIHSAVFPNKGSTISNPQAKMKTVSLLEEKKKAILQKHGSNVVKKNGNTLLSQKKPI